MSWLFTFKVLQPHLQHQPSNKYSALIYFRIDWFDFLAVQGTLKRLLQCHNSKASVLWHSAFFMVQLLPAYMATGKTNFDYADFVGKVMSLLFNMLSRASLVAQLVKNPPAVRETWVQSLGWEDPPEKG